MPDFSDFGIKYNRVFDASGNIKCCGRDATKELIAVCKKFSPGTDFGDENTGVMNAENIHMLYNKILLAI